MASSSGEVMGDGTQNSQKEIDDLLAHLDLREDELEDVVIGADEVTKLQKDARWLAIARVHTSRSFSSDAFIGKMKAVWNLSRDPICREAGENLFVIQLHCLGDWKKVVHQGPWTFRGWAVLIEDYDGKEDPAQFEFGGLYVWAQIHGIPELYRKPWIVDDLARRVGKTREVQMSPKLFYEGNYVRIRVFLELNSPLKRVVSLNIDGEGKKRLYVKYEKVPFFCKHCGIIGHNHEECGDGVWGTKDLQYGDFMFATRRATAAVESRPLAGRGRGRTGRGSPQGMPRKRSSQDAELDDPAELKDDASSPIKPTDAIESDTGVGARRNLNLNAEVPGTKVPPGTPMETADTDVIPPPPPQYTNPRDRSKVRKTSATPTELAPSAASSEEDRRAQ
ncbi:hypothetical protein QYE76_054476 [Lolium multiflorum]|uniref:DUF4283 domain-containing protein n=1 Tax=Lolium multiflorum TaxID=4521 RepID=A0AAD8SYP0_LOLMU|nr:hypothetical protein QYE76_054476 [Lolium multiflorum]